MRYEYCGVQVILKDQKNTKHKKMLHCDVENKRESNFDRERERNTDNGEL